MSFRRRHTGKNAEKEGERREGRLNEMCFLIFYLIILVNMQTAVVRTVSRGMCFCKNT